MKSNWLKAMALLGVTTLGASSAQAGFTTVNPTPAKYPGEHSLSQIFGDVYGGSFTQNGENFTNGSVTATRIDDNDDQLWTDAFTTAEAKVVFSGMSQVFGVSNGSDNVEVFAAAGTGTAASGNGSLNSSGTYRWTRSGQGQTYTSVPTDNSDGRDHLVSYRISGLDNNNPQTTLLFWEDGNASRGGDFDFNDLVVEVKAGSPLLIPLPAAASSGMVGLLSLGALASVKRFRRFLA